MKGLLAGYCSQFIEISKILFLVGKKNESNGQKVSVNQSRGDYIINA